ncbi:winged helix-turn-helix domain-containing protein [Aeoliella sp. ICT_H6.2]|uniref:Winged helix-turn-helix domain-containing protein n=1 Tax=Aeoliella straminimaris TaxID=2954799 RepID=A0A9X2JGU3_9BACT|nr:winged helix-turn-helix domain-containing protein [Aeoliella straminimaris]
MAKKKATSGSKSTAPEKAAPKKTAAKKSAPKKAVAKPAPALTAEEIGHAAGQVWAALVEAPGQTATALKKNVDAPGDMAMAAIGWLAREEKLEFDTSGRTVKISLK